jgi:hypothetical protein
VHDPAIAAATPIGLVYQCHSVGTQSKERGMLGIRYSPPSQNGYGFFAVETLLTSAFRSLDRGDFGRGADMMGEGDLMVLSSGSE